jgi:CubicO group peptidase (beta-lactamase class C family)
MHDVLAGHVERGEVPGLVSLVSRRGDVHVDAIGAKSLGGDPIGRDTIFRIASMSKPITAAATMILVEECKLRLDEPVDRLLPELANRKVLRSLESAPDDTVPASRPITVRDLLTFRMGFGMIPASPGTYPIQRSIEELGFSSGPPAPGGEPGPEEWMRRLGTLPLLYQPGEHWLYHIPSEVLGVLIARASEQPFDSFLSERIFDRLGMKDTGFHVPSARLDSLATSYITDDETGALSIHDEPAGGRWSRPPAFPSGGGGLVSTADDYLAFAQMMLDGGKHGNVRILSRPSVELMTTDHLTAEQRAQTFAGFGWGFGMRVVARRNQAMSVGTYGWDGGLGTTWNNDPREELIIILLTQASFTSPQLPKVCLDFRTLAYAAIDD